MSIIGEERKKMIMEMLYSEGKVRTVDLVHKLGVTSESIRRYLEEHEDENKLKRVYGGAIPFQINRDESSHVNREITHAEEKKKIGRAAARLVQDKDVIILDDGTTTQQMVEYLLPKQHLTVIIPSVPVLNLLIDYSNKGLFNGEIIFVGGRVNAKHYRVSGGSAQHFMESYHVDKAFIVADGIEVDSGATSYDDSRGLLSRAFQKKARQTIVLGDSSKLGASHFYKIADLSEVDMVISDAPPPQEWDQKLADKDVSWIVAD